MTKQAEAEPWRDHHCGSYFICLRTHALLPSGTPMECLDCPNRWHKIPKRIPTTEYLAMITQEAVCCTRLLTAIFHPEKYYHHHDTRKAVEPPADAPISEVTWF